MKEIFLNPPSVIEKADPKASAKSGKAVRRWTRALYFGFSAGIVCALGGLVLGAASYLGAFKDAESANQTGNLMIVAAFPLMMLGAHALDRVHQIRIGGKQS